MVGTEQIFIFVLAMAQAYAKATASYDTECKNQCQLNGECVQAASQNQQPVCVCDRGWTGIDCGTLNLNVNATIAYGMGATPNTSSWGGGPPAYDNSTGLSVFHIARRKFVVHFCHVGVLAYLSFCCHCFYQGHSIFFSQKSPAIAV